MNTHKQAVTSSRPVVHRRVAAVAVIVLVAALVAAGCGSSTTTSNSPATTDNAVTGTTAVGNRAVPPPPATLPSSEAYGSLLPKVTGPAASTSKVKILTLDQPTELALQDAFVRWERLDTTTCKAETIPGQVWLATDTDSGISYGVAAFQPQPGCGSQLKGGASDTDAFGLRPQPPIAVFQRNPGGSWVMGWQIAAPFPCPKQPQAALPLTKIPKSVLDAWKMPYVSPTCQNGAAFPPH